MLELEVLIGELLAVDCSVTYQTSKSSRELSSNWNPIKRILTGLATGTITLGEVTALDHELLDNTVEGRALITEALLAGGESAEVLGGLGDSLAIETNDDASEGLIAVLDIEVDLVGDLGTLRGGGGLREDHKHPQEEGGGQEKAPEVEHLDLYNWKNSCG